MNRQLIRRLHALSDAQPFQVSWYLKDLRSGQVETRMGETVVPAASTRKVAILMAALRAARQGRLQLDQPLTIATDYQNDLTGIVHYLCPGLTIRVQDALTLMIIVSDNVCTGTVTDLVGLDYINAFSREVGMTRTVHRTGYPLVLPRDHPVDAVNTTTAADMGLLLDLLLQGTRDTAAADRLGCTPEDCQLALRILSLQRFRCGLPALLPPATRVANKTGVGAAYRNINDVGVIFDGDQPAFVLAVYTEHVPETMPDGLPGATGAKQLIARLSRTCWDALVSAGGPRR